VIGACTKTKYRFLRALLCALLGVVLLTSSASAVFYPEKSCRLFILLYHDIVDEETAKGNPLFTTTAARMEENLNFLLDSGYKPLSLSDYCNGNYEAGGDYFCITFDDGYLSNYTEAFPLLKRMGIPGDIFAVTDTVGRSNHFKYFHADEMEQDGTVRIYSHSSAHSDLAALTDDALRLDVQEAFTLLETRLARKDRHRLIAYPGGSYTESTINILRECGALLQFVQSTPENAPTDLLKRYMVYYHSDMQAMLDEFEADQPKTIHTSSKRARASDLARILPE